MVAGLALADQFAGMCDLRRRQFRLSGPIPSAVINPQYFDVLPIHTRRTGGHRENLSTLDGMERALR